MRGRAQAHLIECDDGYFYIVKYRQNPQHRRVLVNEWISAIVLRDLQVFTPEVAIVNVSQEFLSANPDTYMKLGKHCWLPEPGKHFGSRFPGEPGEMSVYDFVPDVLLENITNLSDFCGALVFDKWVANADRRQAIFFRPRARRCAPTSSETPNKIGFVTQMVDNGDAFGGNQWDLSESPLQGFYFRPLVYRSVRGFDSFEPWLSRVLQLREEVVITAGKSIPTEWLDGDKYALDILLHRLVARQRRVPNLIEECRTAPTNPFPNWKPIPRTSKHWRT